MRENGKYVLYKTRDPRDPDQSLVPLSEAELLLVKRYDELLSVRIPFNSALWQDDSEGTLQSKMKLWRARLFTLREQMQQLPLRQVLSNLSPFDAPLYFTDPPTLEGEQLLKVFDKQINSLKIAFDQIDRSESAPVETLGKRELATPFRGSTRRRTGLRIPKELCAGLNAIRNSGKTIAEMCSGSDIKDEATMRKLLTGCPEEKVHAQTVH